MPKRLPKITVNGTELNKCPICGEGVNTSAWNKWKKCLQCNKLLQQGLDVQRVKRIRTNEISGDIITADTTTTELDSEPIYNKKAIYNFRTTFPPGVRIVTRNKDESKYLQEVYGYYSHYSENVPEFNVLISGILQAKLDLLRSSGAVSAIDLPHHERKGLKEVDIKLADQINKTTRVLEDLKDRVDSQAGNVITSKFSNMAKYLHENQQEYMGIGICDECNSRIIFKTNFPTFKTHMLEQLEDIENQVIVNDKLDQYTIKVLLKTIRDSLDDSLIADTYVKELVRQLESSLIEGGMNI